MQSYYVFVLPATGVLGETETDFSHVQVRCYDANLSHLEEFGNVAYFSTGRLGMFFGGLLNLQDFRQVLSSEQLVEIQTKQTDEQIAETRLGLLKKGYSTCAKVHVNKNQPEHFLQQCKKTITIRSKRAKTPLTYPSSTCLPGCEMFSTFRSKVEMKNEEVRQRLQNRKRRLEELQERATTIEAKVCDEKRRDTIWTKVWEGILEQNQQKPAGMSWATFFDTLAEVPIGEMPQTFQCDETRLERSKMILELAVHVSNIQKQVAAGSLLLEQAQKRLEKASANNAKLRNGAKRKLHQLVAAPEERQLAEERRLNLDLTLLHSSFHIYITSRQTC